MKRGDVLAYSWGYDQTNVDFFQVVRATEKSAWIRPIKGRETPTPGGFMTGTAKPVINGFTGPAKRKAIQRPACSDVELVRMAHGTATPYKQPMRVSHYA